jgi:peptidoglycan L-alanyl-D-glutamate endopeptidase CwlK
MVSLEGLHPYVKAKAEQLLINANARLKNYKMVITQAYRSKEDQNKLYTKGRTVAPIGKQYIVTNAKGGQSMHNFGLAIDFALVDPTGKKFVWDSKTDFDKDGQSDWMEVVAEGKKLGFAWGGDFESFKDMPHLQMLGGLTDKEVISGKKPKFVTEPVKKPPEKQIPILKETLQLGSTGEQVKIAQQHLKLVVDGKFGVKTEQAVKVFQKKNNLVADGKIGKNTWNKLF